MSMQFQVERLMDVSAEAIPLLCKHYEEIALNKATTPLDPDWPTYALLDRAGVYHVVTARVDGVLVGYSSYIIQRRNLHYKFSCAETDIFYLDPAYRKGLAGMKLLKCAEESLRSIGIERIAMKTKLSPKHDVGNLLERLGYKPIERVHMKKVI